MVNSQRKSVKFSKLTLISCSIALAIFAISTLTVRLEKNKINSKKTDNKAFVSFHDLNNTNRDSNLILKEQSLIFDSEPVFIPTQWSESSTPFKNIAGDALFDDFPPATKLYDQKFLSTIINESTKVSSPSDILNSKFVNPFIGIDQNNLSILPLKKRTAYVKIQNLYNSSIVEDYEITNDSDEHINEELWMPIEFLLITDESGPIMPLLIVESSGTEHIDNFFKNSISAPLLKLSSLPAGYYRISVSP